MSVVEHLEPVSGLEWTVLRGSREEVMRALGREYAAEIRRARHAAGGGWQALVDRAAGPARDRFAAVVASSRRLLPVEAQEIDWIAQGAGLPAADLWALNLRGDLGRDGIGCSDLAFVRGGGAVMGHNEDGDPHLGADIRLVSLLIDGDPSLTAVWYPGMLPANSFVTTSAGLTFGMDHVPVAQAELRGAGRHLVARHAQRRHDGPAARRVLTTVACAGGFAFDVADAAGRVDLIENAAGRVASASGRSGPLRHTNHLCLAGAAALQGAPSGAAGVQGGSRSAAGVRGRSLGAPSGAAEDVDGPSESRDRLAALVAASPAPSTLGDIFGALRAPGVLNRADDLWTFTTSGVDTAADEVWVQGSGEVWAGRLSAFARGERVAV